jgi:tellurite resistance protein TehA-like permease
MNLGKFKYYLIAALAVVFAASQSALSQCALCRSGLEGDPQAAAASHQIDIAVLMLLVPPVLIFVGFFVLVYRFRNHFKSPQEGRTSVDGLSG